MLSFVVNFHSNTIKLKTFLKVFLFQLENNIGGGGEIGIVYFEQQSGASHATCWLKSTFWAF